MTTPTNLSDEGLQFRAKALFATWFHEPMSDEDWVDNITDALRQVRDAAKKEEQDRCCSIVFGQCGSDNVAQRTVTAIRQME